MATTSMLWLIDSDDPIADLRLGVVNDHVTAETLARTVVGDSVLVPRGETTLDRVASGAEDEIGVGVYGRLAVIAGPRLAATRPSELPGELVTARPTAHAYLVHTDTEAAYGVFAQWDSGRLRRSFAADPVDIVENEGLPFLFEGPFWAGEHPLQYVDGVAHDPQALPFHPVEFAACAAHTWLGLRLDAGRGSPENAGADFPISRLPVSRFAIRPAGHQPTDADHTPATSAPHTADSGARPVEDDAPPVVKVARWFGFGKR
ncbi:DUF6928 family protein [Williamsia sp. MIQD14]|uniref:DUF6928 family protein n=1 Tax=Williamsia sp. MIQD14 TaxID=3425703 RepID=UPI003DA173BA